MADLDYAALFEATPSPYLVLGPDLEIVEVNRAYLEVTCRTRQDLLGRHIFDSFPDNAADPKADGVRNLKASLHRVLLSQEPDTMALQKYDIPIMGRPGVFEERWWSPINTPILAPAGTVKWIIHRVEDVTAFVQSRASSGRLPTGQMTEREALEAELFARARELQHLNEELRMAHARERQVAVTLQEAMLQSPDLDRHDNVAVRYLPATGSLNVCGDWYDMVDLPDGRFAVAVGDVVGHGLRAAAVMGMLRSALSAAIRALERPAQALDVLGVYARSVEDALNTTVVKAMVDPRSRLITYSNSGHPPPILVHRDGKYDLLDQALDPPLGSRSQFAPCSQAGRSYAPGDTLVLYTDGLFERRGEDIDAGLRRLGEALGRYVIHSPERLADEVLDDLGVAGGARDDIALIIVQLLPPTKTELCRGRGIRTAAEPAGKGPSLPRPPWWTTSPAAGFRSFTRWTRTPNRIPIGLLVGRGHPCGSPLRCGRSKRFDCTLIRGVSRARKKALSPRPLFCAPSDGLPKPITPGHGPNWQPDPHSARTGVASTAAVPGNLVNRAPYYDIHR